MTTAAPRSVEPVPGAPAAAGQPKISPRLVRRVVLGVFVLGIYTDKVTKVDGRWGFAERYFQAHYLDGAAPPGMKLVDYADQR